MVRSTQNQIIYYIIYILGSHAVVETLLAGHEVVVVDDCSNVAPPKEGKTMPPSLERVCMIVGDKFAANLRYDITNRSISYKWGL